MLTQRSTITKTKRGRILCFTNEHYLRNDITCGIESCENCNRLNRDNVDHSFPQQLPVYTVNKNKNTIANIMMNFDFTTILDKYVKDNEITCPQQDSKYLQLSQFFQEFRSLLAQQLGSPSNTDLDAFTNKHNPNVLLIPDTSVYLEQFDLFEQHIPIFGNIVVLQSILQYFQAKHYKLYQKVRSLRTLSTFQTSTLLKSNFSSKSTSISSLSEDNSNNNITVTPKVYVFNDLHHQQVYKNSTQQLSFNNCDLYLPKENSSSESDEEDDYNITHQGFVEYCDEYSDKKEEKTTKNENSTVEQQSLADFMFSSAKWYQLHTKTLNGKHQRTQSIENEDGMSDHISQNDYNITIGLTNSLTTAMEHVKRGVLTVPMSVYVQIFAQFYPSLPTLLSQSEEANKKALKREEIVYPLHYTAQEIETGLQSGALCMGRLLLDRDYWLQGSISTEQYGRVMIPGLKNMNRAFDGDLVAVKVWPRDSWLPMATELNPNETEEDKKNYIGSEDALVIGSGLADGIIDNNLDEDNDDIEKLLKHPAMVKTQALNVMPTGEVVGIISEGNRVFCGSIELTDKADGTVVFMPINRRIPKCIVESKQIQAIVGSRLLVRYDTWSPTSRFPRGHITRILGNIGDNEAETEMILIEHDIKHDPWSVEVEKCLPAPDYVIDDQERAGRVDLRGVDICSIDPPGCTDIDDALHCVRLPNGNYEVGVHIADVTHYMKPGSALDLEASKRSTSVYLVDRRIDMIPARLSTNLCSLHEHVERLAFSTIWELNPDAEIVDTKFFKSVILSRGAMTYAQAQERIDLQPEHCTTPELTALYNDKLTQPCKDLMMLAKKIKQQRIDNGALSLASSEVKFKMNADRTQAEDLAVYQLKDANSLVEEFMLLANVSVAQQILRYFPLSALLRGHPTPPNEMLQPLVKAAKSWGFEVDISSGKALSDSLDKIVDQNNPLFNKVLRILTTRCMTQAKYMSSGEIASLKQLHHFGLAAKTYTHFTSPIRRYADVLAHRLLATSLGLMPLPDQIKDKAHMRDVVENLNFRHKQAQLASRASTDAWILKYFGGKKDEEIVADALVLAVKSTGVRAIVQQFGIEIAIKLVPTQYSKQVQIVNHQTPEENNQSTPAIGYFYNTNLMTLTLNGSQFKVLQKLKIRLCVKENKNRRRWLHVELHGDSREMLTTDIISLLYKEVVEECKVDLNNSLFTEKKASEEKKEDDEMFRPLPSFIDEDELKELEAKEKNTERGKSKNFKKANNNDVEHTSKKRKPNCSKK